MAPSLREIIECGKKICLPSQFSTYIDWLASWTRPLAEESSSQSSNEVVQKQIKDFPNGYPRFSALIASHSSFHVCRRFSNLRARLLLLKQDRLSILEEQLEEIDRDESQSLSLASFRRDGNKKRHAVLADIQDALNDYDAYLERYQRASSFDAAPSRTISNLQNWVDGTGCIARNETAYLEHAEDLFSLATSEDRLVTWLEARTEDFCVFCWNLFPRTKAASSLRGLLDVSRDPNVHIFSPSFLRVAVYILVAPFITVLLLTPVIICNFVSQLLARLIIVVAATITFVSVLSGVSKARTIELIIAGATYDNLPITFC
ncbi:hypothetical protein F4679DRAFT_584206 [Xylaria curta]|nr:hypothetical protein F4679DRAFT_584206 [Xylaria curta]